ncbi:BMC domain-containing protein [Aquibacillus halophilus]|uniref:BMC domain-containing protein n=1 Tax=Aquibacillus halophilus TaxID=930132 RepID=A0A6A8DBJ3_9BACI|nr:BMC domain-containing protein [Aquibacillus halophilus]MRH41131.1 BMC domain-containing protein [Aquibacillus halophilus]
MSKEALGMIETLGFPALIAAADAATKAANVKIINYQKADAGIVTVYLTGDVASVKAAVDAGAEQARTMGQLLSSHVIPRPQQDVAKLINKLERTSNKSDKLVDNQKEPASMLVSELRSYVKGLTGFPLSSSEINKAKKATLLRMLDETNVKRS